MQSTKLNEMAKVQDAARHYGKWPHTVIRASKLHRHRPTLTSCNCEHRENIEPYVRLQESTACLHVCRYVYGVAYYIWWLSQMFATRVHDMGGPGACVPCRMNKCLYLHTQQTPKPRAHCPLEVPPWIRHS